jgi:hypothetical protein
LSLNRWILNKYDFKYKGLCELEFGNGSFFQVKGSLDGGYAGFSPRHDPAVTALLKKPALKFLTAVSRSSNTGPEIEEQWETLI